MALAIILRHATKPKIVGNFLKLSPAISSSPILRQSANLSMLGKNVNYLTLAGANKILPKVQHYQVRKAHIDHGLLWTVERVWAVALLGIIPLTIIAPSTIMDDIFAITTVIHNHWGLEAIVIDYVRPVLFGETIPKISLLICYLFSAAVLGGLFYFNHNDIGIGQAIIKFWNIRSSKEGGSADGPSREAITSGRSGEESGEKQC